MSSGENATSCCKGVEVEAALARLVAGSYGLCASCRQPIDPHQLAAVPATRYCKTCRDHYELGGALVGEPAQPTHGTVADAAEFLPDDDLEAPAVEPAMSPEGNAVVVRGDLELSGVELEDELVADGVFEDQLRAGQVMVAVDEDDIDDTLERATDEAEETSLAEQSEEELVEEELQDDEALEADLAIAIRRQLGLEEAEGEDLEELPTERAGAEALPRPRAPDEFLCSTCFQLKRRTQLVDPVESRCVDCVDNSADEVRSPVRE